MPATRNGGVEAARGGAWAAPTHTARLLAVSSSAPGLHLPLRALGGAPPVTGLTGVGRVQVGSMSFVHVVSWLKRVRARACGVKLKLNDLNEA